MRKKPLKRNKTHKASFLLLESLLALFLLSITLYLVISPHFTCLKEESKEMRALEMERVADLAYLEVVQELLSCKTPKEMGLYPVEAHLFYNLGQTTQSINGFYQLNIVKESPDKKCSLFEITILLPKEEETLNYSYLLAYTKKAQ